MYFAEVRVQWLFAHVPQQRSVRSCLTAPNESKITEVANSMEMWRMLHVVHVHAYMTCRLAVVPQGGNTGLVGKSLPL